MAQETITRILHQTLPYKMNNKLIRFNHLKIIFSNNNNGTVKLYHLFDFNDSKPSDENRSGFETRHGSSYSPHTLYC